jgi:thiamine-phosphate pyrophosphorylase
VQSQWHEISLALPRLYAIADAAFGDPVQLAKALFSGGARLVQIRNKKAAARELLQQVESVLALAPPDARVVVNDRVDVALISGAAGVHLGQTDLPPAAARQSLSPERIVGFSTHNMEQALEADKLPVDYIAVGPIFATLSKENPDPVVGVEELARIVQSVQKPVVAIGGIRMENARDVMRTGAQAVAVIHSVLSASNIAERVRQWLQVLNEG